MFLLLFPFIITATVANTVTVVAAATAAVAATFAVAIALGVWAKSATLTSRRDCKPSGIRLSASLTTLRLILPPVLQVRGGGFWPWVTTM